MPKPVEKDKGSSTAAELMDMVMLAAFTIVTFAATEAYSYLKRNPEKLGSWTTKKLLILFGLLALCGGLAVYFINLLLTKSTWAYWILIIIAIWCTSIALVVATHRFWQDQHSITRLTTNLLRRKGKNFERLIPLLGDKETIPIGISLQTQKPFYIPTHQSLEHILICGATGQGKTSALITMLLHSMKNNLPAIVIDPKGDLIDIDLIKELAKLMGREDDLLIFSLSNPKNSCSYNFLKVGTPEQRKSKLIGGFSLDHSHYGALAAKYLGTLFDVLDYLKEENIDIKRLERLLLSNQERSLLEERLNNEPETLEVEDLLSKLASIRKLSSEDISGLVAAVEVYGLREFRGVFTPNSSANKEIDLVDVLQTNKIAYFQLNTNGYGDLATRFGKLLVQDIALISSMFQSGQLVRKFEYAGVFIDEFGAFVRHNFINTQKMIRSARMGLRLFFQGMADLATISPQFEDQVMGNTVVKIILRQDVDQDSQKWSGTAGTVDAMIRSYQTETGMFGEVKTGAGNIHEGKKVKIEFDVFKELGRGQAVVIDKGRKIQDVIQIWDAKAPEYLPKLASLMKSVAFAGAVPNVSSGATQVLQTTAGTPTKATSVSSDKRYHNQFRKHSVATKKKSYASV